jgi:2-polyprenyl-3-methyl-5-hydroxy-6-metoxy-1,4-benzoquinol methylase
MSNSKTTATTSKEFFEQKYSAAADPWQFASNPYELHRYEIILRSIRHRHFHRALEPGCSVGVLTAGLASLCAEVDAFDIAPSAIATARERCENLKNVHLDCKALSEDVIDGEFDLIVLCEIGYYFKEVELRGIAAALVSHLAPGGVVVATHWLGTSSDHLFSGDAVHDTLRSAFQQKGLELENANRYPGFRLDQWTKPQRAEV